MLPTVEAFYHDGIIDLPEKPEGIREARVIITFIDIKQSSTPQPEVIRAERMKAVLALRGMLADVPAQRSLSDELIEERRKESGRE